MTDLPSWPGGSAPARLRAVVGAGVAGDEAIPGLVITAFDDSTGVPSWMPGTDDWLP